MFGYFKTKKKVPMTTKPRGPRRVKALVVGPLKKDFFFADSLTQPLHVFWTPCQFLFETIEFIEILTNIRQTSEDK